MEIRGTNFSNYDASHLQLVQREMARSIKPRELRELEDKTLDDQTALELLRSDAVNLSPEAKALLKKLRQDLASKKGQASLKEDSVQALLYNLKQLRDLVSQHEEPSDQEDSETTGHSGKQRSTPPTLSPHPLQLSGPERRPSPTLESPKGRSDNAGIRSLLERMMLYTPSTASSEAIKTELQVMGEKLLSEVASFGTRIVILEPRKALTSIKRGTMHIVAPGTKTFDGRDWATVRGLYCNDRRMLVVGEELLGHPTRSTARHEMAHAYDHMFQERNRRIQPLSVQLFNLFSATRQGVVTEYARTNPAEWFAETVEAWFNPGGRDRIALLDPQMHDYLRDLFP